jgi:branched-chain amino acid transport system substrate-binding protein
MRRAFAAMLLAAGIAVCLSACGSTGSAGGSKSEGGKQGATAAGGKLDKPIVFGAAVALTGLNEFVDLPPLHGAEMAIKDINDAGGIRGQKIQLIKTDTTSTTTGSRTAVLAAIDKGAQVMLEGCNFDFNAPGALASQAAGILSWSQCAGSPKWGVQGIGDLAYTPGTPTYSEGDVIAQYATKNFGTDGYAVCDNWLDYMKQICQGYQESVSSKYGGKQVGYSSINTQRSTNVASEITKIKKIKDLKYIFLSAVPVGGPAVIRQIRAAGIDLPIISPAAMYNLAWTKAVPHLSNFYTDTVSDAYGYDPRPEVNALTKKYKDQHGRYEDTSNLAVGYASVQIIADAIKATGTTQGSALAKYIDSHGPFKTVLGDDLVFTPDLHTSPNQMFVIVRYTNGKPKTVGTATPGKVDLHL